MSTINPANTSFLYDLCYFEIPIAFKPIFLSMDMDLDSIQISNLLLDTHWNIYLLQNIFSKLLNEFTLSHGSVNYEHGNTWVWFPKSRGTKVSTMIYSFFNQQVNQQETWDGLANLWHLKVAPRAKHFI